LTNYGKKKQTRTVKILKTHRTGRFDRQTSITAHRQ